MTLKYPLFHRTEGIVWQIQEKDENRTVSNNHGKGL